MPEAIVTLEWFSIALKALDRHALTNVSEIKARRKVCTWPGIIITTSAVPGDHNRATERFVVRE